MTGAVYDTKHWFHERNDKFWPGQEFGLEIDEILHQQRSKYQDILVFKSKTYGNVLVLDNCIQCTERDEFVYQEMAAFLPLLAHPCPKRVLIIGGGDGGVLREVVKHPQVEEVVLCEIDQHQNEFDVIITDSSDPEGPAEALFEKPYYSLMKAALKQPHGIICCQAECIWLDLPLIKKMSIFCRELFSTVAYAIFSTPTYPCGTLGFIVCSLDKNIKLTEPIDLQLADQLDTRYYTSDIHRAAFALPAFVSKELQLQKQ
ncbi:unnamed protein product [Rotaria sordida]|uniref:PABS domain-containing protein n=1 Tax=Rotaria sordida TaxID=392033 RepID=A0A814CF40_9BILA|nr:unnamed protein product [Rotaria sordida]CAF0995652.1 unnamed protein product [Rotaria sordida]